MLFPEFYMFVNPTLTNYYAYLDKLFNWSAQLELDEAN